MMCSSAKWLMVRDWPEINPTGWLGLEPALLPQCLSSFKNGYRLERLAPSVRSSGLEVRIACQRGEIYPYSPGWWAWAGQPKSLYGKLLIACGGQACGVGGSALPETLARSDEIIVCFPDESLDCVARVIGARRRRSDWVFQASSVEDSPVVVTRPR